MIDCRRFSCSCLIIAHYFYVTTFSLDLFCWAELFVGNARFALFCSYDEAVSRETKDLCSLIHLPYSCCFSMSCNLFFIGFVARLYSSAI